MDCYFSTNFFEQEAAGVRSSPRARPCDGCRAARGVIYCHADAAYLCGSCDTHVHSANQVASHHDRVHVCEECESAPTVLACYIDAAALCPTCDAKVHSANPLSLRHHQGLVLPLPATAIPSASGCAVAEAAVTTHGYMEEEEVDSWLLLTRDNDSNNCTTTTNNNINKKIYFNDVGQYFDLTGYYSYYKYNSNITKTQKSRTECKSNSRYREGMDRRNGLSVWYLRSSPWYTSSSRVLMKSE